MGRSFVAALLRMTVGDAGGCQKDGVSGYEAPGRPGAISPRQTAGHAEVGPCTSLDAPDPQKISRPDLASFFRGQGFPVPQRFGLTAGQQDLRPGEDLDPRA